MVQNLFAAMVALSIVHYGTAVGCWAGQGVRGPECIYDVPVVGGNELEIVYTVNANISQVCCEALQCTAFSCSFVSFVCAQGEWSTGPLLWEYTNVNVNPMMRCVGDPHETFYTYSYRIPASS